MWKRGEGWMAGGAVTEAEGKKTHKLRSPSIRRSGILDMEFALDVLSTGLASCKSLEENLAPPALPAGPRDIPTTGTLSEIEVSPSSIPSVYRALTDATKAIST